MRYFLKQLQASESEAKASSGEMNQMLEVQRLRAQVEEGRERVSELASEHEQALARVREEFAQRESDLRAEHGREMTELSDDYKVSRGVVE